MLLFNAYSKSPTTLDEATLRRFIEEIATGRLRTNVIVDRGDRRSLRAVLPDGRAIVVKLWNLRGARGFVRRVFHRTKGRAEWVVGRHLHQLGIPAPSPIAYLTLDPRRCAFHEGVAWEHLEDVQPAAKVLHEAAKSADEACLKQISANIETITEQCLGAGLFDNDHRVSNFLVRSDGTTFRMDFENAALRRGGLSSRDFSIMLGGLIASYSTMVRPRPDTAGSFAADLLLRCRVPAQTRLITLQRAQAEIDDWSRKTGIAVKFDLASIVAHCQGS